MTQFVGNTTRWLPDVEDREAFFDDLEADGWFDDDDDVLVCGVEHPEYCEACD